MAKQSKNSLKQWFETGGLPLVPQLLDWIDSFWHKDEILPVSSIENLTEILEEKADDSDVNELKERIVVLEEMDVLTSVHTDSSLTGNGKAENPLSVQISTKEENSLQLIAEEGNEGLYVKKPVVAILFTKKGINGEIVPMPFKWTNDLKVKEVLIMSNATFFKAIIDGTTYDEQSLVGQILPQGHELRVDNEITAGNSQSGVLILFEQV